MYFSATVDIHAWIYADGLKAEDLSVELVFGQAHAEMVVPQHALPMHYSRREVDGSFCYDVHLQPSETGSMGYGVRVLPSHPALVGKHDMGLIRWA
jgi:starch phosphorylase